MAKPRKINRSRPGVPPVAIIMGSDSDWPTMKLASEILKQFGVAHEKKVISAHRTPREMFDFALQARDRGTQVIIAGAGGAAHLPGMVASLTTLPVIGVPIETKTLKGLDSLLSIAQMPAGVPVSCMAIGGAVNAALQAIKILAITDPSLARKLDSHKSKLRTKVRKMRLW